jgi:hypothetical protein
MNALSVSRNGTLFCSQLPSTSQFWCFFCTFPLPHKNKTSLPAPPTTEDTIFLVACGWGDMCVFSGMFIATLTTEFQLSTSLKFHYGQLLQIHILPLYKRMSSFFQPQILITHIPCWLAILHYLLLSFFELSVKKFLIENSARIYPFPRAVNVSSFVDYHFLL